MAIIQFSPFHGEGGVKLEVADVALSDVLKQVRRTGNRHFVFVAAVIDRRQHQPVGVGMLFYFANVADDDFLTIPDEPIFIFAAGNADVVDAFNF